MHYPFSYMYGGTPAAEELITVTYTLASAGSQTIRLMAEDEVSVNWGEGTVETITPGNSSFTQHTHDAGTTITVTAPASVLTGVGGQAFNSNITAVDIPEAAIGIKQISFWANSGLTGLTTYAAWTNLEYFSLSECPLPTSIVAHPEWTKLKYLGLYGTDISSLTTYGSEWSQLETLDVAFTNITSITTHPEWINLTYLSFQGTDISSITTRPEWVKLYRIYCWGCDNLTSLTTYPEWVAMNTILAGSNLGLTSFVCHPEWTGFYYLSLNGCSNITSFTTHSEWINLWTIDLSATGISSITTYNTWTNLRTLAVSETSITTVVTHPEWTNLGTLNVDNNLNFTYVEAHQEWTNFGYFRAQACNISSATTINEILIELDISGMSSGQIYLYSGTNAAPTGDGLVAKANLQGRGVTVITN